VDASIAVKACVARVSPSPVYAGVPVLCCRPRGDNQAVLELLVGALHLIAWNCCRKQAAAQDHLKSQQLARKARILANSCACVSWFIRALVSRYSG
jgi:hypothetical protein